MGKGLIAKMKLKRAMITGEYLPFRASHNEFPEKYSGRQGGFGAYQRILEPLVNELLVQNEFDAQVEEFDIEILAYSVSIRLHHSCRPLPLLKFLQAIQTSHGWDAGR